VGVWVGLGKELKFTGRVERFCLPAKPCSICRTQSTMYATHQETNNVKLTSFLGILFRLPCSCYDLQHAQHQQFHAWCTSKTFILTDLTNKAPCDSTKCLQDLYVASHVLLVLRKCQSRISECEEHFACNSHTPVAINRHFSSFTAI